MNLVDAQWTSQLVSDPRLPVREIQVAGISASFASSAAMIRPASALLDEVVRTNTIPADPLPPDTITSACNGGITKLLCDNRASLAGRERQRAPGLESLPDPDAP